MQSSSTGQAQAQGQNGAANKHRACDECRTRKLACTKEPDGCSRCKREGIACHYSPQKPMGRPRKRLRDEEHDTPDVVATNKSPMAEVPPDTMDVGLEFINLLMGEDVDFGAQMHTDTTTDDSQQPRGESWNFGFTGNAFGDVNFDPMPANHTQSFSPSNIDPALFVAPSAEAPPADPVPALSPNSASTPQSNASNYTTPAQKCACTASLYLALDSMQKLSTEVEPAIRQARMAAKTAYEVVNCPVCSSTVDNPGAPRSSPQMMQNFQNLMLLATLIPSIVHAYERILAIVDQETNRSVAERRKVIFKLGGLGGIWGSLGAGDPCGTRAAFGQREMEPAMWRLTVRALLKVDVYGISGGCPTNDSSAWQRDPFHLGLKDIVLLMENKSKARHVLMDAMIAAGAWQLPDCTFQLNKKDEPPQCQRIIAIARSSVDQLVIA
ncbi:Uu.00g040500.m01.CDS01 [Anthostomella pinea]|uniref:Uu.00g040500.m01.CDS01 n=1 Tax=Anthostomella pinea TaxID=933095 RepID=A0AAI8YDY6_9PEZI|nr:Uu.00g040500.m01.CDS01 [Anthostomella pinea]